MRGLENENLNSLKRFLLHSGSLKKVAAEYSGSYPTVRLRLDRLIQKAEILEEKRELSAFEQTLRVLLAYQTIAPAAYQTLLEAHRKQIDTAA
ncbi:MAG: DUF2089 family protein [Verrucomicrobiales bacterium]|nr:DUF2089 family protein [Verrucomicrobiales bacterium]